MLYEVITKYKSCHLSSVEFLRSLPIDRLTKDLDEFSKLVVSIEDFV